MNAPSNPARHAGFFTFGIAIAVIAVCGGLAGGGRLLHQAANGAAERVAAESAAGPSPSIVRADDAKETSYSSVD